MRKRLLQRRGFTLTEVLVASMLLSIVMTAVYTLFYSVISTWRSEEHGGGQQRSARALLTLIDQDYANLHEGAAFLFEGKDDEITFYVMTSPLGVEAGEGRRLMRVHYQFNHAGKTVVREEATVKESLPTTSVDIGKIDGIALSDQSSVVVATGVSGFTLHYLWVQRPDSAYWQNRPMPIAPLVSTMHRRGWGLPQAIEVNISLAGRDEKALPLLVNQRFPTRTLNRQRDARELARMMGEAP